MKTGVVIQARMGSTRLPGKVMMKLYGKTVLEHVIERVKLCSTIDDIVIATTDSEQDSSIEKETLKNGVKCFRGSEENVLSRYCFAARENKLDPVIRITSDCPLIDPHVIDRLVSFFKNNSFDLVTNVHLDIAQRTYPRGLDTEVFSAGILQKAFREAKDKYQREHVTPYIYENSDKIYYYKNDINFSRYRWTLDTPKDFEFIKAVYGYLYKGRHNFFLEDILQLLEQRPELACINAHIEQKKIK